MTDSTIPHNHVAITGTGFGASDAPRAVADTGCFVGTVTGQARQATRKTGY